MKTTTSPTAMAGPEAMSATATPTAWVTARGTAVSIGPSVLLNLLVMVSTIAAAIGRVARPRYRLPRRLRPLVTLGIAFLRVYMLAIRLLCQLRLARPLLVGPPELAPIGKSGSRHGQMVLVVASALVLLGFPLRSIDRAVGVLRRRVDRVEAQRLGV